FSRETDNSELLAGATELVQQIHGALRMVQLPGIELLSGELLTLLGHLAQGREPSSEDFAAISASLFILPRYLELTAQRKLNLPQLLLPQINDLRKCSGEAALAESYFFSANLQRLTAPDGASASIREEFEGLVKRLRHMYQLGLLQTIREPNFHAIGLMERALQRLQALCGGYRFSLFWWVAAEASRALQDGVGLNLGRKLLLRDVDREIRRLQQQGEAALDTPPDNKLLRELLYLASLGKPRAPLNEQLTRSLEGQPWYSEAQLQQFLGELHGPSLNTVHSVVQVLEEEFKLSQSILEMAAQAGDSLIVDFSELLAILHRISDALGVLGLSRAHTIMDEQIATIQAWHDNSVEYHSDGLVAVADAMVYVESTVAGMENLSLSDDNLEQLNHLSAPGAVGSSQLAEAEAIVVSECQAALMMAKRALSSFAESGFDLNHIGNISNTINSVRGGLNMIGLNRAAAMVAAIHSFVDQILLSGAQPPALDTLLETLADAVISLEYYLASYGALQQSDDSILILGEESMASLGFPVAEVEQQVETV
ncbi:MAG: pilus assembly protein, partial [Cellvibrionaceae bacterium]|nr:pilus assembly protein [Cellvibrionaceae bacterium]